MRALLEMRDVQASYGHAQALFGMGFDVNPGEVRTEAADVIYLLGVLEKYFPAAGLTEEDVIGCYAGVRPLVDDHAETESTSDAEMTAGPYCSSLTLMGEPSRWGIPQSNTRQCESPPCPPACWHRQCRRNSREFIRLITALADRGDGVGIPV